MTTHTPQTAIRHREHSRTAELPFHLLRIRPAAGRSTLVVIGALDIATVPRLKAALDADTALHIVVDLGAVPVLSADGISVLAAAARRQAGRGGALIVVEARPLARRCLDFLGQGHLLLPDH